MGLMPGGRVSKSDVNYKATGSHKCGNCDHYYYNSSGCDIVQGNISPESICDQWEDRIDHHLGKDRAFYDAEWRKDKKRRELSGKAGKSS